MTPEPKDIYAATYGAVFARLTTGRAGARTSRYTRRAT